MTVQQVFALVSLVFAAIALGTAAYAWHLSHKE